MTTNVKNFGASGDGRHDDVVAIQQAINWNKAGGVVLVPSGTYMMSRPLVLPRTGFLPSTSVQIVGDGQFSTVIRGMDSFPSGRGLIEWAPGPGRILGQRVSNLTLYCPMVDRVSAIKHVGTFDSQSAIESEWLQLDLERVHVECSNSFTEVCFDLPNGFRFSTWRDVTADPWRGDDPKYDTLLLRTLTSYPGGPTLGEDSVGIGFSSLSRLCPMMTRGGWCRTFEGRACSTSFRDCFDNGGRYGSGSIAYHFVNSTQLILENLACEGQGSMTLMLDGCDTITARNITSGTPQEGHVGYQDGITVRNSRNVRIDGRIGVPGSNPFSALGVKSLVIDKDCVDCTAERFDVRGVFTTDGQTAAAAEMSIEGEGCRASGACVQAWSRDGKGLRQPYSLP